MEPNGCLWCGILERDHASRFAPVIGQHTYTPPTNSQRFIRMLTRRRKD